MDDKNFEKLYPDLFAGNKNLFDFCAYSGQEQLMTIPC